MSERIAAADRELHAHVRGHAATVAPPAATVSGARDAVAQARPGQRPGAHHRHTQPPRHPPGDAGAKSRGTAAPSRPRTFRPAAELADFTQLMVAGTAEALSWGLAGFSLAESSPSRSAAPGPRPMKTAGTTAPPVGPRDIAKPVPGINKVGFICHKDGANIRTGPREAGGLALRPAPLPPATQVFVGGTHPGAPHWLYATALLPAGQAADGTQLEMVRGYVQDFRITTDLPEPLAKLYLVKHGDTAEGLARRMYHTAIRDGHDLRYYENVLYYVNQVERHLAGVRGTYQDPGLFGGGANNVQLVAGEFMWLVSPVFAQALEDIVPSGSLTGGLVAKARRLLRRIEDILASIAESRHHLGEVAEEIVQTISDHLAEIIGIIAAFLAAEALSIALAAVPGGQLLAALIQLALSAFGAAGAVEAGAQALKHASEWLTLAWNAQGNAEKIAAASKEFLWFLVSVAMAALAYAGAKASFGKAVEIASSLPPGAVPALAIARGGQRASGAAGAGVRLGVPGPLAPVGTALATTVRGEETGSSEAASAEPPAAGHHPEAEPPAAGHQPEAEDLDPSQATRPEATGGKKPRMGGKRVATRRGRLLDLGDFELLPGETTQRQALARIRRVISKKISDTPLGRVWEQARREVVGNRSLQNATRQEMLELYDKVRNRFWDLAKKDPDATRTLQEAGFEFGTGRAPLLRVNDPAIPIQERRISLDHNLEKAIGENYKKAIDADNLTFEFHNPNSNRETIQVKFGLRATEAGAEE